MTTTRSPRLQRQLLSSLLVALLLAVTSCSEELEYDPPVGVSNESGTVDALSLTVVTNCHGAATLVGTLYNQGPITDSLLNVTATSPSTSDPIQVSVQGGSVPLPPLTPVELAEPVDRDRIGTDAQSPAVTLTTADFREGAMLDLTLTFAYASPIDILVLIYPQEGIFDEVPVPDPPVAIGVPETAWCSS